MITTLPSNEEGVRGPQRPRTAVTGEGAYTKGLVSLVVGLLWLTGAPGAALAFDLDTCGQEVPREVVAELRGPLSCGPTGPAVFLGPGATLNLNGFTIAGPGTGGNAGVLCRGCTITGPGEIRGFGAGVSGGGRRVSVRDVTLRFNGVGALQKGGILDLSNVVATDNDIGISMAAGRLRGWNVQASENREAGISVTATMVKLYRLTASGNGNLGGLRILTFRGGGRSRVVDSTILDNDGLGEGYDVLTSVRRLKLVNSVCGRGARIRVSRTTPKIVTVIRRLGCRDD